MKNDFLSIFGSGGFAAAKGFVHWSGEGFSAIAGAENHGQARFSLVFGCENIAPHSRVCELRRDVLQISDRQFAVSQICE